MSFPDWNAIHAAMGPRVRRVTRSVLRDEHEAEDAVQDTFLRAVRSIGSLRNPAALSGWMLTLARRVALDRCRKLRRTPQVAEEAEDVLDNREAAPSDAIEVAEAFARMPSWMQRALNQRARGWSFERAAAKEGISVWTAKSRLSRARSRLRELAGP